MGWWWVSKTRLFVFAVIIAVIIFLLLDLAVGFPLAFVPGRVLPRYVVLILAVVIFILLAKVVDRARDICFSL